MNNTESYLKVLKDNNLTEEQVQEQVTRLDVLPTLDNMYIKNSPIHGTGCFTKRKVNKGCIVCPMRIGEKRTLAGRYTNHAANPNTYCVIRHRTFVMIALRPLEKDEEVTVDYQYMMELNQKAIGR